MTVQRQVLQLMRAKARDLGTAILFITHDLAVVSQFCDRVYVMYAGSVVEDGPTAAVLGTPMHPYTRALLQAVPECAQAGRIAAVHPRHCSEFVAAAQRLQLCPALHTSAGAVQQSRRCKQWPATTELPAGLPRRTYEQPPVLTLDAVRVRFPVGADWLGRPTAMCMRSTASI